MSVRLAKKSSDVDFCASISALVTKLPSSTGICNSHFSTAPLLKPSSAFAVMNVLILLIFLFLVPFLFFLVFLALSSCLGDRFRARIANISFNPRHGSYGRSYTRGLGSGAGSAGWEQIEMEDMMSEHMLSDED